eukprot:scaffold111_cov252-Pinguiococcus_pyrenoidosus.AAC.21
MTVRHSSVLFGPDRFNTIFKILPHLTKPQVEAQDMRARIRCMLRAKNRPSAPLCSLGGSRRGPSAVLHHHSLRCSRASLECQVKISLDSWNM